MLYRWLLWLRKPSNNLWVTPTLGALLAIVFALAASLGTHYLEEEIFPPIDRETLASLLDVLASSMLAVSTFSLSIMVSAFASASSSATPRATELVMGDDNTRLAIASFISAFIYAIIARVALDIGYYGANGRFILFISTTLVLAYLVFVLIRWVHTLSRLGRMANTLDKIYQTASRAMLQYRQHPAMDALQIPPDLNPDQETMVRKSGFLTHINIPPIQKWAEDNHAHVHILARPGDYLLPGQPMLRLFWDHALADDQRPDAEPLHTHLVQANERSFDQDPRFGMIVLSEVAQRALSPAVNDPGTAFNVLALMTALLLDHTEEADGEKEPVYDRVSLIPLKEADLVTQAMDPIARDGAGNIEIALRLQKILSAINTHAPEMAVRTAAAHQARLAYVRARSALPCEEDRLLLQMQRARYFGDDLPKHLEDSSLTAR